MKIAGGCLCGDVRYSAETDPLRVVVCHCMNCQKQSGTSFSIVLAVAADALTIKGETKDYLDKGDSGGDVIRRFCARCGSPVVSLIPARPQAIFIKAGTLDDTSWLRPEAHIWRRSAQPWVPIDPALPSFHGPYGVT